MKEFVEGSLMLRLAEPAPEGWMTKGTGLIAKVDSVAVVYRDLFANEQSALRAEITNAELLLKALPQRIEVLKGQLTTEPKYKLGDKVKVRRDSAFELGMQDTAEIIGVCRTVDPLTGMLLTGWGYALHYTNRAKTPRGAVNKTYQEHELVKVS